MLGRSRLRGSKVSLVGWVAKAKYFSQPYRYMTEQAWLTSSKASRPLLGWVRRLATGSSDGVGSATGGTTQAGGALREKRQRRAPVSSRHL